MGVFTGGKSARRACVAVHSPYINRFLTGRLPTRKNTQKSKFLLSQTFNWKKKYVFRNPRLVLPDGPLIGLLRAPIMFNCNKKSAEEMSQEFVFQFPA